MPTRNESINLLGVRVSRITRSRVIQLICQAASEKRRLLTAYTNVHSINLAQELPWFREYLNRAEVTFCDGYGVLLGARLLGQRLPERFTPPDWFPELAAHATQNGLNFFLLGTQESVLEQAAARLQAQIPGLRIAGLQHGFFDKSPGSPENEAVIAAINTAQPDILVIGLGQPLQERWLLDNWPRLQACVALPVGAMFDFLAGETSRAPRWMTDHGLEWLGRLLVEPGRLWQRYLVGNPRFFWQVLRSRLRRVGPASGE